jgi:hypothetical protein
VTPPPPVPNVLRVQLKHTLGDDFDVLCRFFIQYAGSAPSNAELDTYAGQIGGNWVTDLRAYAGSDVTLSEVIVTDLTSSLAAEGSVGEVETGTRTGGMLPAATALLINFAVARRYRGGKPRIYLPLGTDTDVATPQTWAPVFVTEVSTQWAAFMAAVISEPWAGGGLLSQVVPSFYMGSTGVIVGTLPYQRGKTIPTRLADPLVEPITGFTVNPIFGSQRRRNRPK